MDDTKLTWVVLSIPGLGDFVSWMEVPYDATLVECEQLSQIITQNGRAGLRKVMDHARINMTTVAFWTEANDELKSGLSQLWGRVLVANANDKKRILES